MRKNYIPLSLTYTLTFISKNNIFDFQSIINFYIYINNDMRLYGLESIYNFASENDTQNINRPKPSNLLNSDGDSSPTVPCNGTITLHTKKGFPAHTWERSPHTRGCYSFTRGAVALKELRKTIGAQTTRRYPDVCRWKNKNLFYNPQNHRNFSS